MDRLFVLETDRAILAWSGAGAERSPPVDAAGRLHVTALRPGLVFLPGTWRAVVPPEAVFDPARIDGPALLEESVYEVYARAKHEGDRVTLHHEDPHIRFRSREEDKGR